MSPRRFYYFFAIASMDNGKDQKLKPISSLSAFSEEDVLFFIALKKERLAHLDSSAGSLL